MYKILLHKPNMAKGQFCFYQKIAEVVDETVDPPATTKTLIDFSTDEKTELQETYIELLNNYTKDQIKIVEELDVSILVDISDSQLT